MATASRAAAFGDYGSSPTMQAWRELEEEIMAINSDKVDEMTLALMYLTTFKDRHGLRTWKSHDWDVLNRLHEGAERSKRLFEKHFMTE
jgi:hypothetical protein